MSFFLYFSTFLSIIGFFLTLIVHLFIFFKKGDLLNKFLSFLFNGIFVISIPTVIFSRQIIYDNSGIYSWLTIFTKNPDWMKYTAYFLFSYTILHITIATFKKIFFHSKVNFDSSSFNEKGLNRQALPVSAMIMSSYFTSIAVFYSALQILQMWTTHTGGISKMLKRGKFLCLTHIY